MATTFEAISEKLKTLTSAAQFVGSVGTKFRVSWGTEESAEFELIEATPSSKAVRKGAPREPFSLLFRAASTQFYLPQGIYQFEHPNHDTLHIFLVPIGPDERGMCFQAVFS